MNAETHLHQRLRNCLQTIMEMQGELEFSALGMVFKPEIDRLQEFLKCIDTLEISEREVLIIEEATDKFLRELNGLIHGSHPNITTGARLQ